LSDDKYSDNTFVFQMVRQRFLHQILVPQTQLSS